MSTPHAMYAAEKDGLLPTPAPARQAPRRRLRTTFGLLLTAVCAGLALYTLGPDCVARHSGAAGDVALKTELCPQPSPLVPSKNAELWKELGETYGSKEFLGQAVELLGGAVRVP